MCRSQDYRKYDSTSAMIVAACMAAACSAASAAAAATFSVAAFSMGPVPHQGTPGPLRRTDVLSSFDMAACVPAFPCGCLVARAVVLHYGVCGSLFPR